MYVGSQTEVYIMHRFRASSAWFPLLQSASPAARLVWMIGCALLLWAAYASAEQVDLAWDAVSAPALAGYRLHYGQTPGTYTTYIDVGLQTTATVTGLTPGQTYFFVVTAYDTAGNESGPSDTVSTTISPDTPAPDTPMALAAGDFNGDGKADLVWCNSATGEVAVWLLDGPTLLSAALVGAPVDRAWLPVGVGDINGDGKADLVWRNSLSGQVAVWFLNGPTLLGGALVGSPVSSSWQLR